MASPVGSWRTYPHLGQSYLAALRAAALSRRNCRRGYSCQSWCHFSRGLFWPRGKRNAYFAPSLAAEGGTLYEHAARALDVSLEVGSHGLPLMGTGDWNDGMNRVGVEGPGESVWLDLAAHRDVGSICPLGRRAR